MKWIRIVNPYDAILLTNIPLTIIVSCLFKLYSFPFSVWISIIILLGAINGIIIAKAFKWNSVEDELSELEKIKFEIEVLKGNFIYLERMLEATISKKKEADSNELD